MKFNLSIQIRSSSASGYFRSWRRAQRFLRRGDETISWNKVAAPSSEGAWFRARRSLISFNQQLSEFETYVLEDDFGGRDFRMGAIRLDVSPYRHQGFRRLHGQTVTTANHLADDMDDLSNYLGPEDQERVDEIIKRLAEFSFPKTYRDVISLGREAAHLYHGLLERIEEREGFQSEQP